MTKGKQGGWNKGKGKAMPWLVAHVDYNRGDCLKWPFSLDTHGYGQFGFEGKMRKAHRVMCELAHGPAPTPKHEAAHSCGRGHQGCIPMHLSWKTRSQNQLDRAKHGTQGCGSKGLGRCKLRPDEVAEIKRRIGVETNISIAKRFGVTPSLIIKIKKGELWQDLRIR